MKYFTFSIVSVLLFRMGPEISGLAGVNWKMWGGMTFRAKREKLESVIEFTSWCNLRLILTGQPRGGVEHGPAKLRESGLIEKLKIYNTNITDLGDVNIDDFKEKFTLISLLIMIISKLITICAF